ncbi:hypothetical protein JCM19237_5211 [Photobacterium aphoticum]|uniref:Uncharacterized protein n=1 Tax=Photobacterium aphoticum TaxID=754436 RepID=A0A090QJ83_9GAMM|nr:hypothetical protein JCM19237_5211 [Photobacterium aphoticum]
MIFILLKTNPANIKTITVGRYITCRGSAMRDDFSVGA